MAAKKNRVKHIAFTVYPVKNVARARRFYEKGLGLKLGGDYQGKWLEYYLNNGCFALTTYFKGKGVGITFEVDDVDAMYARLLKGGATKKMAPFSTPVCRNAFLKDPDGNTVGLHAKNRGR
jgi:predicted enzyme related to lactoylglutathione lyase